MSDCGCDDDDEEVDGELIDIDLPIAETGLPAPPCLPDGAVTGGDGSVTWGAPWRDAPADCDDWTAPLRPDPSDAGSEVPTEDDPGDRPVVNGVLFRSAAASWTGTRDDCGAGKAGDPYTYALPAGAFQSRVSVADANAKANAWLTENGPQLARQYGTCSTVSVNPMRLVQWAGTSGCALGLIAVAWGALNGPLITGCPTRETTTPVLVSVSFEGVTGCPAAGSRFFALTWDGTTGCV